MEGIRVLLQTKSEKTQNEKEDQWSRSEVEGKGRHVGLWPQQPQPDCQLVIRGSAGVLWRVTTTRVTLFAKPAQARMERRNL